MDPKAYSGGKARTARGFSCEELKRAGLDVKSARKLGIRVDLRRTSAHDENVNLLKQRLSAKKGKKEKKVPKKTATAHEPKTSAPKDG